MKPPKANDLVFYMPTDGPYKGKLCPAVVTQVLLGPGLLNPSVLVNLEVRTAEADFVENVANVPLVNRRPKKGECCLRSQLQ